MKHLLLAVAVFSLFGCHSRPKNPDAFTLRTPTAIPGKDYFAELSQPIPQEEYEGANKFGANKSDLLQKATQMDRLFGFARTEPAEFFKFLRTQKGASTADEVVLQNGILTMKGAIGGNPDAMLAKVSSKFDMQGVPNIVVATKYDDVIEGLERNQDFTVYTNRTNMNNTVGHYMLAYEETHEFNDETLKANYKGLYDAAGKGIPVHPGKPTPHYGKKLSPHSIDFRGEKAHMWKLVNNDNDRARVRKIAFDAADEALATAVRKTRGKNTLDFAKYVTRSVPITVVMDYFGFKPDPNDREKSKKLLAFWSRWTQNSFFHNPKRDEDVNKMAIYAVRGLARYKTEMNNPKFPGKPRRPTDPSGFKDWNRWSKNWKMYDKGMNHYVQELISRRKAFLKSKGVELHQSNMAAAMQSYYQNIKKDEAATVDLMLVASSIHADAGVNEERLVSNVMGLLVGAVETGNAAAVQALKVILDNERVKEQAVAAAQADDIDKFNKIVWEALRFDPINPWVARYTVRDTTLGGVDVKKGSLVLLSTESAMHDPSVFNNPDDFDYDRYDSHNSGENDYSSHPMFLHMGAKRHTCLGFDVAYEFVPASLYRLFKKYPNVKQEDANKGFSMAAPNAEYINPFPESYRLVYQ